jgi:ribonuclease HI
MMKVYTDGSSVNNGKKNARAGYAVVYPDRLGESWGDIITGPSQTNQTAELTAIYEGIRCVASKEDITIHIYTDSEYSINCLTKWVTGWKKRDWKTSDGKPVVHREIIEKILIELKQFAGYVFTHVKAHTNGEDDDSRYNQIADDLARKAVEKGERVMYTGEVKIVRMGESTDEVLKGIPLAIMGPPISEKDLFKAMIENLGSLDDDALKSALLTALRKTLQKNNYELEKSKVFKTVHYRLVEKSAVTITRLDTTE